MRGKTILTMCWAGTGCLTIAVALSMLTKKRDTKSACYEDSEKWHKCVGGM